MLSICGLDCCSKCDKKDSCGGCIKTNGHPLGGDCIAAEAIKKGGFEAFQALKQTLIDEFNSLGIEGLKINDLNLLNGFYVNLEYTLANGDKVKLLEDNKIYFGNQIEKSGSDRCYGVVADDKYLLVCEYGCNGAHAEIITYKRRKPRGTA